MASRRLLCCLAAILVLFASIASASFHHESQHPSLVKATRSGYRYVQKATHETRVRLHFALSHSAEEYKAMHDHLMSVSDPSSSSYGKHLKTEEVRDIYGKDDSVIAHVRAFLQSHNARDIQVSFHKDMMSASFDVASVESMLSTQVHEFEHIASGFRFARSLDAHVAVPAPISQHVAFVSGLSHFANFEKGKNTFSFASPSITLPSADAGSTAPLFVGGAQGDKQVLTEVVVVCQDGQFSTNTASPCADHGGAISGFTMTVAQQDMAPFTTQYPLNSNVPCYMYNSSAVACNVIAENLVNYAATTISISSIYSTGTPANSAIATSNYPAFPAPFSTPSLISDLYHFTTNMVTNGATQSVSEFLGQYYSPQDLQQFFEAHGIINKPVDHVIGPNDATQPGGEADLDIQYIMALAQNATNTFWSFSGGNDFTEPFIDWLWAIGNTSDAVVPKVHSTSYGDLEISYNATEIQYLDGYFMRAGLRGISFLFSAGDDGVGGFTARSGDLSTCTPFTSTYPAGSAYVTAIGGTQLSTYYSPVCSASCDVAAKPSCRGMRYTCTDVREIVCSAETGGVITTGGGTSFLIPTPDYQKQAVADYLSRAASTGNLPPSNLFNRNGRFFPDFSTLAHNYLTVTGGEMGPVHGTSASAPTAAAMITLINDARMARGLPVLGFLNPLLYKMYADDASIFNDVVVGSNNATVGAYPGGPLATCPYGFSAVPGFDAVSGLGSLRFDRAMNYILTSAVPAVSQPSSNSYITQGAFLGTILPIGVTAILCLLSTVWMYMKIRTSRIDGLLYAPVQ